MWVCVDGEGVSLGRGEVERCVEDLREKAQQLLEAQHRLSYLNHLQHIMKLWFAKYRGKKIDKIEKHFFQFQNRGGTVARWGPI